MAGETERSLLERIAALFLQHDVEFIVIGGQAETLHGSPRVTYDVDVCYRRSPENLQRLAAAVAPLNPRLRGVSEEVPFRLDAKTLSHGSNFTLTTDLGDLHLIGFVEPIGEYEQLKPCTETYQIDDLELAVLSLEDLIRVKRHIGREKDRQALIQLLAIQRERHENES